MKQESNLANPPVIVVGGGGHAKVLISALLLLRRQVLGYVDVDDSLPALLGIANLGDDDVVLQHATNEVRLVNGVGSGHSTRLHQTVFEKFAEKGYVFETVIHPNAFVASEVDIEVGAQLMAGAVIQTGVKLGENVIVNTSASVDHDCLIDSHAHIAPGVTLSGGVHVGPGSHIGAGASVIQGVTIGARSIVGAGAVVIRDVPEDVTVVGIPAAVLSKAI